MSKAKAIEPEKKGRGRPSKFDGIDQEQARKLAERGWTDVQMSDFFAVTERTWNNWKESHPEFFQSLTKWKDEADAVVERCLYEKATGWKGRQIVTASFQGDITVQECDVIMPPDTTACIYWLKNRKPKVWRDQPESEEPPNIEGREFVG